MVCAVTKARQRIALLVTAALSVGAPFFAYALTPADTGLGTAAANAGYKISGVSVPQYVGAVINVGLGIIGIVFLILVVYGGLRWMLAQGEESKVNEARNMILHAIVGLIVVLAAFAITNFVVGALIKATID